MDSNFLAFLTGVFFLGYGVNQYLGNVVLGHVVAICAIIIGFFGLLGFAG